MATVIAYDPIEAPCLGCSTPLLYEVIVEPHSAPEILPPDGAVAYRGGHLCGPCASFVGHKLRASLQARSSKVTPMKVSRCSVCREPAHASETDDRDRCVVCRLRAGAS